MANTIKLTPAEWKPIRIRIKDEYSWKPSIWLIRTSMKRELGFTIRMHKQWVEDGDMGSGYKDVVCLDFYNEQQETLFRLKYL